MQNKKIGFGIVSVLVLVVVFYGGMVYGKNQNNSSMLNKFSANRQGQSSQFGQNNIGNRGNGAGFTMGEIIAKDDKSITVKITNGVGAQNGDAAGSKIILLSTETEVTKSTTGSTDDLAIGTAVSIGGTINSDGSITAKTIQIRPQMRQNSQNQ